MPLSLCLITCDFFYREIKAAIEAEGFSGVEVRSFPAACGVPPISWKEIMSTIQTSDSKHIEILGCYCLKDLEPILPAELRHCTINRQEQCFHMLCSKTLVNTLQAEGAFLLTPGWLVRWQNHMSCWNFNRESAIVFFGQSCKKLVLLDTGLNKEVTQHLDDLSSFLELPNTVLPIGIDFLGLWLAKIVSAYQEQFQAKEREKAERNSADASMALDLLGRITQASSETAVVNGIIELFSMLLAPEEVLYIRVEKQRLKLEQLPDLPNDDRQLLETFFPRQDQQYLLNESQDSFLLRIGRGNTVSAILMVKKLAFPQYIAPYLNVALHISRVCALAIDHARTTEKLLSTSRKAGRAEIATEILHNVGNTLNSISVSSQHIQEILQKSSSATLPGIVQLIEEHSDDAGNFFANDPRGLQLPLYFSKLSTELAIERQELLEEISRQNKLILFVNEIIQKQQDSAKADNLVEIIDLLAILEIVLDVYTHQIQEEQIKIERDYVPLPAMQGDRNIIMQILNNLIINAIEALSGTRQPRKTIYLQFYPVEENKVVVKVSDNGAGIAIENLNKIFVFGFTTKKNGYGYGLHNASNLARSIGGNLQVESGGEERGAMFTLTLPVEGWAGDSDE